MNDDIDAELGRLLHHEHHGLSLHQPARPSWLCRACRTPWPCPRRWAEFSSEFGSRLDLACYLVAWLHDATADHPDQQVELHERFLAGLRAIRFTAPTESASHSHLSIGEILRASPVPDRWRQLPHRRRDHDAPGGARPVVKPWLPIATLPAQARAWSATAPGGDVLAEAAVLAAVHRLGPDGFCLGCLDRARLAGDCRDGAWARAALAALRT